MGKKCVTSGCELEGVAISRVIAKYCARCGKELMDLSECEYCEHELYPQDKFCEFCGRPVK